MHNRKRSVKRSCKFCKTQFFISPSRKEYNRGKYCSKICYTKECCGKNHHNYKHGYALFKKMPRSIHCKICKKLGKNENHHIDGNTKNNEPSNIITLCLSCHRSIHGIAKRHHMNLILAFEVFNFTGH